MQIELVGFRTINDSDWNFVDNWKELKLGCSNSWTYTKLYQIGDVSDKKKKKKKG